REHGWQGVTVSQALMYDKPKAAAITFDDGSETDLLSAAPVLHELGFGATFFITSGFLGRPGYLSQGQLVELSDAGFEIGCHSRAHPYLDDLDEHELRGEIAGARDDLEQVIGRRVTHFACPGGRYGPVAAEVAREAGYASVSTSRVHANFPSTDRFALG